jgi:preprotein translocase subunit SecG
MFENQTLLLVVIVLIVAVIIGFIVVGILMDDSESDTVETSSVTDTGLMQPRVASTVPVVAHPVT